MSGSFRGNVKDTQKRERYFRGLPKRPNSQCNQIGLFWKGLGDKFACKSSQNIHIFWAILKNTTFKLKATVDIFWQPLEKLDFFLFHLILRKTFQALSTKDHWTWWWWVSGHKTCLQLWRPKVKSR